MKNRSHPLHEEFVRMLWDAEFHDPMVELGSLVELRQEILAS